MHGAEHNESLGLRHQSGFVWSRVRSGLNGLALMLEKKLQVWAIRVKQRKSVFASTSCTAVDKARVWYSCQLRNGQSANAVSF